MLTWYRVVADPSTSTEQKKRGLYDKASGTKEAVKQSVDEKVPEDSNDESPSPETKGKSFFGRFRGMKVVPRPFTFRAGTHLFYLIERPLRQDPPGT